jgi:hypothetical protein
MRRCGICLWCLVWSDLGRAFSCRFLPQILPIFLRCFGDIANSPGVGRLGEIED